jgi:hypothetical protein
MKQNTRYTLLALALLILAAVGLSFLVRHHPDPVQADKSTPATANESAPRTVLLPPRSPQTVPPPSAAVPSSENSAITTTQLVTKAKAPGRSGEKVIQDPVAREALAMVGTDPAAEE